jgi:hypothetical protein
MLFKSLIANMAGFLLWLSITSIMIEVFKAASGQWLLFLYPRIPAHSREHGSILIYKAFSKHHPDSGYDLFYNGRNSPKSLQAHDPALGGYIIQIKITSSIQVPCHCKHAPLHLGANASCFSNHHIVNKPD